MVVAIVTSVAILMVKTTAPDFFEKSGAVKCVLTDNLRITIGKIHELVSLLVLILVFILVALSIILGILTALPGRSIWAMWGLPEM